MQQPRPASSASTRELIQFAYGELRQLARRNRHINLPGISISPTDIVNEACTQLLERGQSHWQSPAQFRAIALRKMRQVVADHLRMKATLRRGGTGIRRPGAALPADPDGPAATAQRPHRQRLPLESIDVRWEGGVANAVDLSDALEDLFARDARVYEVVIRRWFSQMTNAEIADALEISVSAVEKAHRRALRWLEGRLSR